MKYKAIIEMEQYGWEIIKGSYPRQNSDNYQLSDNTEFELEILFGGIVNLVEITDNTFIIEVWFDDEPLDAEIKSMDNSICKVIKIEKVEE